MGFLSEIGTGIITLSAVLVAIGAMLRYAKGPIARYLDINTTPADVYQLVDEVHTGVSILVGLALADEPPTEDQVKEALEVLKQAGIVNNNVVDDA